MKTKSFTLISLLTFTLFLFEIQLLNAQETNKTQAIRVYSNFSWVNSKDLLPPNLNQEINLGYFTPSFSLYQPKGNFHEIELSRLLFHKTKPNLNLANNISQANEANTGNTSNIYISLRYEYGLLLFKKKANSKLSSYFGFSASPYYSNSKYDPIISFTHPSKQSQLGASLAVIPRINYNLNEKWFLDLNIPIDVLNMHWSQNINENPALTESSRKVSTINFNVFPEKILVRFGLGLRI